MLRSIVLMISGALLSGMVWASGKQSTGGSVSFTGYLVESLCDFTLEHEEIKGSCYRDGKTVTSLTSLKTLSNHTETILGLQGGVSMRWLNEQHTQGIFTVNYQ